MSAFWIFAVVLTAAYIVYYTVIVLMDLWKKPGEERKSSEETFELKDAAPAPGRVVEMTGTGFRVAGGPGPDVETVMTQPAAAPASEPADDAQGPKLDASGAPVTPVGRKIRSVQEDMDEIDPSCSGEMTRQMLTDCMISGGSNVPIDRTVTSPEEEQDHDAGQRI